MFAARANQENAIHEQQTAAAAKPLNQGVKGLAPKTPANKAPKTPFKVALNDENAALGDGKTGGKGKVDRLFGEGRSGKVDRSAFATPGGKAFSQERYGREMLKRHQGPRNRAPLGNKTTNAKATAFQTPAPPTQEKPSAKPTSPRLRRGKIRVHEAQAATSENHTEEREVEYMPPREVPLPDYPDDWPHDRTYPQFEGKNLTRGWWSEFALQKGDEDDDEFSDFEEKLKQLEEREKKQQQAQQAKKALAPKASATEKTTRDPLTAKQPQTLKSKHAASALSKPAPSTAATAKSRAPSTLMSKKPSGSIQPVVGNTRHTAAKVASNTTLGYSKGRAVSNSARQPPSEVRGRQVSVARDQKTLDEKRSALVGSSLDDLFGVGALDIGDDEDVELGGVPVGFDEEDEDLKDFQLDVVEI